jgi:hypothetical protein
MKASYQVHQAIVNPRDGTMSALLFENCDTRAEAVALARKELKGQPWVVTESRVVASSPEFQERLATQAGEVPA